MNADPILCRGDELFSVLSDLRKRNLFPWAVDTAVGGNAGYRVSYFQRMTEEPQSVPGRSGNAGHAGPAALPMSPSQGETPANPAAPEAVKRAVAPRNPLNGPKIPSNGPAWTQRCVTSDPKGFRGAGTVGVENSIKDRLGALQDKLRIQGKLRRSKPKTPPEHARLPHKSDYER